jgi:pimeloyl-ACP methyl ester carboxylesterase
MTILHVDAAGATIDAISEGTGPAILIVHPGSSGASSWGHVADLLGDAFRVVRMERRIYAAGASVELPHTMATEAADVIAVAEQLDRPLLVGHSSGAVAALEAALVAPDAFAGMVLYEPPLPTRAPIAGEAGRRARAALDRDDPVGAMEIHLREIVGMPTEVVDAIFASPDAGREFAGFAAAQIADNEALDGLGVGVDRYAEIDLPTVLVEGDRSPAHLRERLADLAGVLPNVERIVTLVGVDHFGHLTAPDRVADVVRDLARHVLR